MMRLIKIKTLTLWWKTGATYHCIVQVQVKSLGLQRNATTHNNMMEDTEKCYAASRCFTAFKSFKAQFQGLLPSLDGCCRLILDYVTCHSWSLSEFVRENLQIDGSAFWLSSFFLEKWLYFRSSLNGKA